ncbi:MAG: hypothetical protein ACR2NP_08000 [Pirellulaceae bacterium]
MNTRVPVVLFSIVVVACLTNSFAVCHAQEAVAIYTMNADGTNARFFTVTEDKRWNGSGSWSHDGTRILYDVSDQQYGNGENHVIMRALQGVHYLDFGPGSAPAWSPDDSQIAFMIQKTEGDEFQHGIWTVDANGIDRRFVCSGYRPAWSPDGKSIVYSDPLSGRNQLFIRNLETDEEKVILDQDYRLIPGASFSPDGNFIAFIGYHEGEDQYDADLGIIDLRPEEPELTIRLRDRIGWHPKWSPDGQRILFFKVESGRAFRIATVSPFGADKPVVLKDQDGYFYNADASWSPNGSQIVFSSDRFAVVDELHGLIGMEAGLTGGEDQIPSPADQ